MPKRTSRYCHEHAEQNGNWFWPKEDCQYCRISEFERIDAEKERLLEQMAFPLKLYEQHLDSEFVYKALAAYAAHLNPDKDKVNDTE